MKKRTPFPTTALHLNLRPFAGLPEWQYQKIQTAIRQFRQIGGVLDFALFAYDVAACASDKQRYAVHLHTAKKTLYHVVAQRNAEDRTRLEQWAAQGITPHTPKPQYSVFPDPPALSGTRIPARSFWGGYLQKDASGRFCISRFGADNRYDHLSFVYAFLKPPYALRLNESEQGNYCLDLGMQLFGEDLDQLEVYSWNTDCSDYFDDGHEWWGAFFWTVYCPQRNIYIGITGSATD